MFERYWNINNMATSKHVRETHEFDDFGNIQQSANAKITRLITKVSPVKRGKTWSYYDGEITDDKDSVDLM